MVNTQVFTIPLRIAQSIFAIIELGLTAYVVNRWAHGWWSPSQANFLLFCSIWTLLVLIYLILAPLKFPRFAHKSAILGIEAVTMIFWFAGFIAFAVLLSDIGCGSGWWGCRVNQAAAVFGAFEWLLFMFSTVLSMLYYFSARGKHTTTHDPNMEVHPHQTV
ncbi:membrane-associating domain-containing protein [Amylocarpus encephaloides]|uniref:Membrane-associating domain-containing protein n=1 Tax=Amylocarpus encephaloides TaxID=45428 RepID=A0A9P7Y7R8_9HELO|nr:membrane-associating domain-containing protein [Amylocarpus encephaloides]